jgi:hypothetical protein
VVPDAPHVAAAVPVAQVPPLQHPPTHGVVALHAPVHAPLEHVGVRPPHDAHAAPAVPHAPFVCDPVPMQLFPEQQPVAHEAALHAHAPATHAWPAAQDEHAAPPVPQAPAAVPV